MGFAVNCSDVSEMMTPTEMIVSVGVFYFMPLRIKYIRHYSWTERQIMYLSGFEDCRRQNSPRRPRCISESRMSENTVSAGIHKLYE